MAKHPWLALVLGAALVSAGAQPPAVTTDDPFKPPQTPSQYWAAVKYEIAVGKFDLAASYLKGFVATNPTDQDLLAIEKSEGLASILELRLVEKWSDNPVVQKDAKADVETVIERVTAAVRKQRTDPARIARFVKNLTGSPEEAAYAENELRRAGAAAMPALIAQLRETEDGLDRAVILRAIGRLPAETVPPLLAATDMADAGRVAEMVTMGLGARADLMALRAKPELDPTPTLFHLMASPKSEPLVQRAAKELLARILAQDPSRLPIAKAELVKAAERFHRHEATFNGANPVQVWRWTGTTLEAAPYTPSRAEEYMALRYLRWALEIDPAYEPAQVLFLMTAIEKGFERGGLATPLSKGAPDVYAVAAAANGDILMAALERALREKRSGAALGLVQVLGDRAEINAARPNGKRPGVLVQALDYPDRRVQLAAAEALVNLPGPPVHDSTSRVIEVLRRALSAEPGPGAAAPVRAKVLVGDFDRMRGQSLANDLRKFGFVSEVVRTGRELLRRLNDAADIDVVILHSKLPYPELPEVLAALRSDVHHGLLPVFVMVSRDESLAVQDEREARIRQITRDDPHVRLVRGPLVPTELADDIGQAGSGPNAPLSDGEKKANAVRAIESLRRAAVGRASGYDVAPAAAAIRLSLGDDDLAPAAIDASARLPLKEAQQDLANLTLSGGRKPELRTAAAAALVRHVQQFGVALAKPQLQELQTLADKADTPADLKGSLAVVLGGLHPAAEVSGGRLRRFEPPAPSAEAPKGTTPPATPPKKPEEKDKE